MDSLISNIQIIEHLTISRHSKLNKINTLLTNFCRTHPFNWYLRFNINDEIPRHYISIYNPEFLPEIFIFT